MNDYKIVRKLHDDILTDIYLATGKSATVPAQKVILKNIKYTHVDCVPEHTVLSKLKHKNIISLIDILDSSELHLQVSTKYPTTRKCLNATNKIAVLEYSEEGDLCDYLMKIGPIAEQVCKNIMRQLFSAVEYIHEQGYMHSDLKPDNIILFSSGCPETMTIKIIDFGFCCRWPSINHSTSKGSFEYASPELIYGNDILSREIDIWALGCIMYVVLYNEYALHVDRSRIKEIHRLYGKEGLEFNDNIPISNAAKTVLKRLLNIDINIRLNYRGLVDQWLSSQ
jgi:serine/threonine protein kinase